MEIIIVGFVIFSASVLAMVGGQHLRRAPLPVGCTPVNGVCCQEQSACYRTAVVDRPSDRARET